MKATTIKLEGELLEDLEASKPTGQSLTAYVRAALRENLDRIRVREAAVAYRAFVESNDEEKEWLEEWDRADLNTPPRIESEKS